ncbi:TPR domain protein putative component of TonB system [Paramagnetospirillum magnetotacticum MS-1]|uniref:TPR domain protein putative component of TonB system n=1 Tax=Paramagnetospirillum magnetotacticum MS-1 TaxID=272627 RepID=A0A0C2YBV5_PARME|nr:tetratricopeptide repeat protein [Paramagnetospirillum magnetotacticum]KIL97224.1 TPR domain protein putative component of TonB system [Paramagnetospirillum magnetotacticum MS-1]
MTDEITADIQALSGMIENELSEEILEYCRRRLGEGSTNPYVFLAMGMISFYSGDPGLAIQLMERGLTHNPDCRELVDGLAAVCTRIGRLTDGLYYGKLAVCLKPRPDAAALLPNNMASYMEAIRNVNISHHATNAEAALQLGMLDEALLQAQKHLRVHSDDVDCMMVAARTLLALGRPSAASAMLRAALHHKPADPWLHALMGEALMGEVRHSAALAHQKLAWDLSEGDEKLRAHLAGTLVFQSDLCRPAANAIIDAYLAEREAPLRRVKADIDADTTLFGVMWDQVYDSPLIQCVAPVTRNIPNVVLYGLNPRQDHMSEVMRSAAMRPRQSTNIDDATLGRIVGGDKIGCLINLCAPADHARFPVFKGERVPLVVHWVTWPVCDRIPGAALVISDAETLEIDARNYGPDQVLEVSRLLAFDFPKSLGAEDEILDLPRNTRGFAMFGVHGDPARFNDASVALWSRVLCAVPGSRLLIGGRDTWEEELTDWALAAFAEYGVANRVHFQEPVEQAGMSAARAFNHMVDVVLDTVPVTGAAETATDLWMGVPVVTLRSDCRAGRVGASILRAAGCDQWIAGSEAEYVEKAATLAMDPRLGAIRAELRDRVLASSLATPETLGTEIAMKLDTILARRRARS